MNVVLKIKSVVLLKDNFKVLDNINFTINEGEHWVILGPNASGKTTLLNLISGYFYPTKGNIMLLDKDIENFDIFERRSRIGMLSSSLVEKLNVKDYVIDIVITASYGYHSKWKEKYEAEDLKQVNKMLKSWNIENIAYRKFFTLSEGEKKKVQIARALMSNPEILLLDEPMLSLDFGEREKMIANISNMIKQPSSPASMLVTHCLEEIPQGFTHAMLIKKGQLIKLGKIYDVINTKNINNLFEISIKIKNINGRFYIFNN